ncbi:thioredoxin family protein [Candidatus Woesearchaeota archaeon]|nr:thioredoxin family protein [Candidatus Woesearchaeota archaeon]
MTKKILLFLLIAVISLSTVIAQNPVNLYFFYGQGCPHCAKMEIFLEDMQEAYPTLNIMRYEVYFNPENSLLLQQSCGALNADIEGIPTSIIGEKIYTGFSDSIAEIVEARINYCLENPCETAMPGSSNESQCIIDDSDPINPQVNQTHSIIGWAFIALVLFLIIYIITKRKKPKHKTKRK